MNPGDPQLSIIVPAYNEEARLGRTLFRIHEYFGSDPRLPMPWKLSSSMMARRMERCVSLRSGQEQHLSVDFDFFRTMGIAARDIACGAACSKRSGRIALFTDADLSAPIEESEKLLAAIAAGQDVAIGSRAIDRSLISAHQSVFREAAGIIFNAFVRLFIGLRLHDTQCGFKAFVREPCRIIFEQQRIEGFGFDPEVLFLAVRHGLRTAEVPVRWAHDPATKVHVVRDSVLMFGDLMYICWNRLLGRYPVKRS